MDVMQMANSLPMWIACGIPVCLVIVQACLFLKSSLTAGKEVGLEKAQLNAAIKSSAVTSIGPSIVVLSGMLSLLVTMGGPVGWMRLSMIGSVMFEGLAAGIGTQQVGVTLGTDPMTGEAYAMALWTMILCSIGWVIFATFSANKMDKIQTKLSGGSTGKLMTIASCAIIGVFSSMCAQHLAKPVYQIIQSVDPQVLAGSYKNALACILGAVIMFVLNTIANKKDIKWLKEWALTITIVAAMVITAVV
ncbi:MAG: DUF5058 family protein [Mogibacterium sp.]|nr:DUF5058 family protein [Mogibacterium sp.]